MLTIVLFSKVEDDPPNPAALAQQPAAVPNPPQARAAPPPAPAPPAPRPNPKPPSASPAKPTSMRTPFNTVDDPPMASSSSSRLDDAEQPRKRKVPARPPSPPRPAPGATSSRYFSSPAKSSTNTKDKAKALANELQLPPHRQQPLFLLDSDDDMPVAGPSGEAVTGRDDTGGMDSSDYDFDFDEGELVAVLDKVEKEHEGRIASSIVSTSHSVATSSSRAGVVVQTTTEVEIISIDDEEDEKENVPVPTRQVRRRVAEGRRPPPVPINEDDIIELSD